MPITQTITVLSTPPSRADPENFDTRADAFLGALPTMQTQMNTWAGQANQTALDIGIVSEGLTSTTAGANKVPLADANGKIDTAWLKVGTGSGEVAAGTNGVTNGDSHDHNGGDGAQIAYSSLSGTPTLGTAASKDVGTGSGQVAAGDHDHASTYQPLDSDLTALAGLSTTGLIERTGAGTAGIVTVTTAGKAILDDADAAAQRTTLGIGGFSQDGSGNFSRIVPGGSTAYPDFPVRAWANVNGYSATPSIVAGGNVSSLTDNGTGSYTVNLTSAMADADFAVTATDTTQNGFNINCQALNSSSSSFGVYLYLAGSAIDSNFMAIMVR